MTTAQPAQKQQQPPAVVATRELIAALRSSLLRVKDPPDGYLTAEWSALRVVTNLRWPNRSDPTGLTGLWLRAVQPNKDQILEIKPGGLDEFDQLMKKKGLLRIELLETKTGPVMAVGGPIPVS